MDTFLRLVLAKKERKKEEGR